MTIHERSTPSAPALRRHLRRLEEEQALAVLTGLARNSLYMDDLSEELEAVRSAYVGAAVSDIATLRAAIDGPLLG